MTNTARTLALLPVFAAALVFAPSTAEAATLTVCASGCGYTSIQAAVSAAGVGDHIDVSAGTYGRVVIGGSKDLSIEGHGLVTLDAGSLKSALRVKAGGQLELSGVTVTGASVADAKAGIINEGTLVLDTVYVSNNDAMWGGIVNYGDLSVGDHSVISSNASTSYFAGGVNNLGGTVTMTLTTIIGNDGWNGGGASNLAGGFMSLDTTSVSGNSAYLGGGIHNSFSDLELLGGVSFTSNHATTLGGGWSNHNVGGLVTCAAENYANNSTGSGQSADFYDVNGQCTPI